MTSAARGLAPLLTPHGQLLVSPDADAPPLPSGLEDRLAAAFALGAGHGLLQLGAAEVGSILPPAWSWWRDFSARYVTLHCATPEGGNIAVPTPDDDTLQTLVADAPPMTGVEYLTVKVLATLWAALDAALRKELAASKQALQDFLKARHAAWNLVGR